MNIFYLQAGAHHFYEHSPPMRVPLGTGITGYSHLQITSRLNHSCSRIMEDGKINPTEVLRHCWRWNCNIYLLSRYINWADGYLLALRGNRPTLT
jgi:hypothetical protein